MTLATRSGDENVSFPGYSQGSQRPSASKRHRLRSTNCQSVGGGEQRDGTAGCGCGNVNATSAPDSKCSIGSDLMPEFRENLGLANNS